MKRNIPINGDFGGDGSSDLAAFRPFEYGWCIRRSSNLTFLTQPYGTGTEKPVAADHDKNGKPILPHGVLVTARISSLEVAIINRASLEHNLDKTGHISGIGTMKKGQVTSEARRKPRLGSENIGKTGNAAVSDTAIQFF